MTQQRATLVGLTAILLWSALVGLIRSVSEGLGPVGGAAVIYTLSAVLLMFTVGMPRLSNFPRRYLIVGSLLFVSYELCLSLSLGYAASRTQAIEVGMINYLWPGMTILLAVCVNQQKVRLWLIPGLLVALAGICRVLGGSAGFSFASIRDNLYSNPLSYGLAFSGAVIWAVYCVVTKKMARGSNGITLFFLLTALVLWLKFFSAPQPEMQVNLSVLISLILATAAIGFGYAAWNFGILHGNVTVMATASYFIPVFSALLASFILQAPLSAPFWQGAAMVSLGSLLCWGATRER
uniref:aromatic amino acid DMT transporter YddG n=1 Tax=Pantoea sp. IMH TaxID=1267600 RepID=UPI0004B9E852|nr:aromatic amino acid DMT transporter YddG [Pantoea sp. IMH]